MFALIIIFAVALILIPLTDLTIAERFRVTVKVVILAVTLLYLVYLLYFGPKIGGL